MSVYFSADEIFEMAEQIERNGVIFYRAAAEKTGDSVNKKLLDGLAAMEAGKLARVRCEDPRAAG